MRRPIIVGLLLIWLTAFGMLGIRVVTGASWVDCLYITIDTLTTRGNAELKDLDDKGKLFIAFYLVTCLGIFTYSAFQLGHWIVSAEIGSALERRRMKKEIEGLNGHYIVCGLGRMGSTICEYLHERGKPFVVIELDDEVAEQRCTTNDWLCVVGDATDDEVLQRAGIRRARALATVLSTDADNVYVVLSARLLNGNLQIVARASDEKAIEKIQRAGATRIVSPFSSGAEKMARFMLNPTIEDFLEVADARGNELELADVQITADSPYVGKQLMQTDLRDKGVMIIGIRRASGERLMPPPGTAVIQTGDSLFAFGSSAAVNSMIEEYQKRTDAG